MKEDGVDRIDLLDAVLLQSVAFEGVFLLLHLQTGVQILHSDSALDGAQNRNPEHTRAQNIRPITPEHSTENRTYDPLLLKHTAETNIRPVLALIHTREQTIEPLLLNNTRNENTTHSPEHTPRTEHTTPYS